jgi:two-component system, OmpR family, alkaline phosphatase synthesis response regulator PhoP
MTRRLLVVEDEEHLSDALKLNFEAEGFEVVVTADGQRAIEAFHKARQENRPFDLIVLDLMLPKKSGYEVCQEIRSADRDAPVLILSARSMVEDRVMAFDVGADQFLQKPFSLSELLARVRNLLARGDLRRERRPASKATAILEFGQAVVNFRSHEIIVRGVPQKLSPLHLQLLQYFAENEGIVLTREDILDKVWGSSSTASTTRVVDNAVLTLRKMFEDDPSQPRYFQSFRGAGYKFVADPPAEADQSQAGEP